MAEADIDAIEALADGATGYGAALRGAMTTLQTRATAAEAGSLALSTVNGYRPMVTTAHGASGLLAWDWTTGNYKRITSAGFNITGITETSAPSGDTMRVGVAAVFNTHATTSITVDFTAYGVESTATILAGESDVFMLFSVPAP